VPLLQTLTGSSLCQGAAGAGTLTMTSSEVGVNYTLVNAAGNVTVTTQAGTGSALVWTGLASGSYYVVAVNATTQCTTTTAPVSVTVLSNPTCSITGTNVICSGTNTVFTATAGMASYSWTGPGSFTASTQTTGNISTAGTYTVTITNSSGCSSTCARTLTVNALPTCSITGTNVICSGTTTSFSATAGMTSYAWTGPGSFTASTQSTGNISTAGTYTVTITDANGCQSTCSRTLTVNTLPTCSITGTNVICQGTTTVFTATAGMSSYAWTGPGSFTASTQTTGNIGTAGTYTVTITDANGCQSTCSRTLTVNPLPTCSITGTNVICSGTTTSFSGPAGMTTYAWTGPGSFTASTQSTGNISVAGTYTLTITNSNGCQSTCTRVLTVNALPTCSITGTNVICSGTTTSFSATAGMTSYAWTGPGSFTASTQSTGNISTAGTYTVTITDANGCQSTCSRTLTVNPLPSCSITGTNVICSGTTTSFSGPAGMTTYAWTGPGSFTASTQSTGNISVAGTYTLTITNSNGCQSTCTRVLTVNPLPTCSITGTNVICSGTTTSFSATAGMTSYAWTGPSGFTASTQSTGNISTAGTYTVTITDANGCQSTCTRVLTVNPLPTCSITGTNVICSGTTTSFSATAGMTSYAWTGPGSFTASTQSTGNISTAGTYTVTITDANGCQSTCSRTLTVNPLPSCSITGTNVICSGTTTSFSGPAGMTTYAWTGPGSFTASTQSTGNISVAGTYTLTITNSNGCQSTCTRVLTVNSLPTCDITGTNVICTGTSTVFTATAGMTTYAWTGPGSFTASTQSTGNISTAGTYTVTITNSNGCQSTCSRTLTVNANPTCSITGTNIICSGTTTSFSGPAGMTTYAWTGPGSFTASTQSTGNISVAGTYTLTVTSSTGCTSVCSRTLTVNALPTCNITGTNIICSGTTTSFSATAGMASYAWTGPGSFTASTQSTGNISTAGTYTVTITDANGCQSTCSRTLTVNPLPSCSITGTNVICSGTPTSFSGPAGMTTYAWTGPGSFTASTQSTGNISVAGTYTLTITNSNGCQSTCTRTLTVNANPTVAVNSPAVCPVNLPATITATPTPAGTYTYTWQVPATATNPGNVNTFNTSVAGTYTVTITNSNGCTGTGAGTLTVYPAVTVSATATPATINLLSPSHSSTLAATATPSAGTTYTWAPYPQLGFTTAPNSSLSSLTGASVVFTAPTNAVTNYKFLVTATSANGCTATATVAVATAGSFSCPPITPPAELCVGTAGTFTATGPIAQYTHWDWSAQGATISGTAHDVTSVSVVPTQAGTYTVTLTVSFESSVFSPVTCTQAGTATMCVVYGCTLGFWKNHTAIWDSYTDPLVMNMPAGTGPGQRFTTSTLFMTYFPGIDPINGITSTSTMLDVLKLGGGGCVALARNAIAALLSEAAFGNTYAFPGTFTQTYNTILATLGGAGTTSYTCSTLNSALDMANNNEYNNACSNLGDPGATRGIRIMNEVTNVQHLNVIAAPNPFTSKVRFIITSPQSGHAQLDVLNILGQRIATVFDGNIQANNSYEVQYNVPSSAPQNMMYILRMGNQQVTGKLLRVNQ
ncbi:MAG: beta strand repeat-containing protein, partial [Candidatus Dadabacteria bacterium]